MQDQNLTEVAPAPTPRHRRRGCLLWLGGFALVVLGLLLAGAVYESAAEASDVRAYPPPGQMVDVGGHRLHIFCVGTGSPTVVIEAGWGDWSATWSSWVQPEVAKTTRVCTYDRAGMGWSEPGPMPRTAEHIAEELHSLLQRAGVPGPYVLAGHSMGGLTMRVFADRYAADVAGLVLIDSMNPRQSTQAADPAPPPLEAAPASGLSISTLHARIGMSRLLAGPLDIAAGLAPERENAYVAYSVTPRSVQTWLDEGQGMGETMAQAGTVTSLGALPLIVLSRGLDPDPDWQAMQTDLLQLSSRSQQLTAEKSAHNVQIDQPEAATAAIVTMVETLRER
jgi:pimeloyl-ACP methyl ester carboxylesterase